MQLLKYMSETGDNRYNETCSAHDHGLSLSNGNLIMKPAGLSYYYFAMHKTITLENLYR